MEQKYKILKIEIYWIEKVVPVRLDCAGKIETLICYCLKNHMLYVSLHVSFFCVG